MSDTLSARLEQLDHTADYSDPNLYLEMLYGKSGAGENEGATTVQTETQGVITAAAQPAPAAPAAATTSASPGADEQSNQEVAEGVATKDGKHIIPYAVLENARTTAAANAARVKELAEANERLQQQLLEAQAGKPATSQPAGAAKQGAYSADRIAAIRDDIPEMAELMESHNALLDMIAKTQAAAPAAPAANVTAEAKVVQTLIDERPMLSRWQSKGGVAWDLALRLDEQLQADPEWSGKPMADRFAEVERLAAAELGVDLPTAAPEPQTPSAGPIGARVPAPAITTVAPTLSDFSGRPVTVQEGPIAGLTPGQAVDKMMGLSLEEIMRSVGVNH